MDFTSTPYNFLDGIVKRSYVDVDDRVPMYKKACISRSQEEATISSGVYLYIKLYISLRYHL